MTLGESDDDDGDDDVIGGFNPRCQCDPCVLIG